MSRDVQTYPTVVPELDSVVNGIEIALQGKCRLGDLVVVQKATLEPAELLDIRTSIQSAIHDELKAAYPGMEVGP